MITDVNKLIEKHKDKSAEDILAFFIERYGKRIALASSLSIEDQVLTDMIIRIDPSARIFVLDTGRLHQETYGVIAETMKRYKFNYEIYFPDTDEVEKMESLYGPNFFYESAENRRKCCEIRKVKPLRRVLNSLDVWITGLRKEQCMSRSTVEKIEYDDQNRKIKLNPVAEWHADRVWNYIKENNIPYNSLYDKDYASIGCVPCTRPINNDEDIRAGRWWWEDKSEKECGMHQFGE